MRKELNHELIDRFRERLRLRFRFSIYFSI